MKFWELVKIANRNLLRSKLRTFLTVTAIFVGSFTLTLTNGLGDGLRDYVENQVKNIEGKNILFIRKKFEEQDTKSKVDEPAEYKETTQDEAGNTIDPNSYLVSLGQVESLSKELTEIKTVSPRFPIDGEYITLDGAKKYQFRLGTLSEGMTQKVVTGKTIDGTGQIILPLSLAKAFDENIKALVGKNVIIGYKVEQPAAMKTETLKIVGVATKGFMANYNCFIDTQTARKIYDEQNRTSENYNRFDSFTLQLKNGADEKAVETLKMRLEEKGFSADSYADRQKRTYDGIGILQIGLNLFAFIALLAASFGIVNTLVIAVLERTKEIGLQKALGMGRGKVFMLFSIESVLIGFWGAVSGIVSAIIIGVITNIFLARTYLESFEGYSLFVFTLKSIIFVIVLVCAIAFLAGVLPAFRASRLNPIEALRYE
jgi:putative ABC transport system permease protein